MTARRAIAILGVVVLVATAGCAGVLDDPETDPGTASPSNDGTADPGDGPGSDDGGADGETGTADGDAPDEPSDTETSDDGNGESPDSAERTNESANVDETDRAVDLEDGEYPDADSAAAVDDVLPIDVYATHDRVTAMLESDASMPRLEIRNLDPTLEEVYDARQDAFQAALNATETDIDTENARGVAYGDRVAIDPNAGTVADVEQALVHEYVHSVQFDEGWIPDPDLDARTATSTDYRRVETALIEGGAVWVTDRYSERYQSDDVRLQSERLAHEYRTAPDGDRFFRAVYYYGERYVDRRIDDPAALPSVYEDPPVTTEQLLHGREADATEPTNLSVATESGGDWSISADDRRGELYVRNALETELAFNRSAEAAAGWGNDRLLEFWRYGDRGFVWVLHWDDPEDADEFEAAFEDVLAARTDADAAATTVDRRGDETVVVTVGPSEFREAVTVSGEDTEIEVGVGG